MLIENFEKFVFEKYRNNDEFDEFLALAVDNAEIEESEEK